MMKSLPLFATLISCLFFLIGVTPGEVNAQTAASVTWNLTAPDSMHVSALSGSVSSGDQTFSNLYVPASGGYTSSSAQRTSAKDGGADGTWPGESAEVAGRYTQFRVAPVTGNDFLVTSVSLYLWVNSGSNMRANVYYSTDSTFGSRTQIGSTFTLSSTAPGSPNVSATPNVTASSGGGFYVRVYPWYTTATTGKYVVSKIVTISGTTTPSGNFISTSAASLPSFAHVVGAPSATQSYTVSGTTLVNNVVVTPPLNFEISTDAGSSWNGNASPVTLTVSGGVIVGQPVTILARLNGGSASPYSGNITHTSVTAAQKDVAVDGVTLALEPTTQSAVSFGTLTTTTIDVNFSGGNGARRIVVARASSAVSFSPTDGVAPAGVNSNFSTATDQGSGNKIVYDGTGSSVSVSGLSSSTTYHFASYEYNVGSGNSQNYKAGSPGTGNATTQAATAINVTPTSLAFGGVVINTVSSEQTYTLSGTLLSPASGNITVTAPAGYRISTTSGSGFDTLLLVPYTASTLGATTVYVRFEPTAVQAYNGNIQNAGGGAATKNVSVTGSGSSASAPNEFQAEDGLLHSAYVMSQYAGYTGSGYVDIANKTGASLEFLFRRTTAVSDTVRIYYALGASSRTYAVSLNGSSLGTLNFTGTGAWTTWSSVSMVIALQAGVNRLNFAATTNTSENANIDRIVVGGQAATALYKLTLAKSGPGTVAPSPPSSDSLYDAGTSVTLTATPSGGYILHHWSGSEESASNPLIVTMNSHKTEIAVFTIPAGFGAFPYHPTADGFAGVNAFGHPDGTTGGSGPGSQRVYVSNYAEFADLMLRRVDPAHVFNFPPLTVCVIGTISGSDMVDVKDLYDVSIIGVGVDAKLSGFGLNIVRSKNVIVRNLLLENSTIDGITVQADDVEGTGNHIWIDHCTVTNGYDGAIDVTHTASYVTVSWNHIHHHDKACLQGHSDSQTSDVAMKVTWHHNYFDSSTQRHPRVRYGKAHAYNNYYKKNGIYGVSSNLEADVVVEGSYFLNVPIPTETSRDGSPPGDLVQQYNIFAGTTGVPGTRGTAFDPSSFYAYSLDSAGTIPAMLSAYSGSGKFDFSSTALLPPVYTLSLSSSHGSITKNPDQATYDSAATVQLTAVPSTGYHFVNWSGDLTGSVNPSNIVMSSNRSVTANFAIDQFTVTATSGSNGSISPSGAVSVNYSDSARFTFTPSGGYHIDSVIVDGVNQGTPGSYTFYNVQANHTIRAVFAQNPPGQYTLTVGGTNGTVSKNPDQAFYPSGTVVHLTANPSTGYHFTNWTGDLTSSSSPDSITMNADKSVTANFALNQYALNVAVVGSGSVAKDPDQFLYNHGTEVSLTPSAPGGWFFSGWSGDATGAANPLLVTMTGVKNITATFVTAGNAVVSNGTGGGSWTSTATWQGGFVPLPSDSVVILGSDSVTVLSNNSCAVLGVSAGGRLALYAQLSAINVSLSGKMSVFVDTMKVSGEMTVTGSGIYTHAENSGRLPVAVWNPGSTLRMTGVTTNAPSNGNQNFHHIIWDCPAQTVSLNMGWDSITIGGNITVLSTGAGRWQLTAPVAGDSSKVVINGDIIQSGGQLTSNGTGNGNTKITIEQYGNVTVTGGNFSVSRGSQSGTGSTRWYLYNGNFSMSNATTQNSNPTNARFVFSKSGIQSLNIGSGNTLTALPFEVEGGTTLNLGTSVLAGSGAVTVDAAATLECALSGGLDAALAVSGTRTFSTASSYIFDGSSLQVTGDAMPDTLANLTINNSSGVTLSDSILVNGMLAMDDGDLILGGKTVTLGAAGTLVETPGNTAIGLVKATRSAVQGVDQSFGGIGLTLNAAGASPGATSVTRITGVAQTGGPNSSILRAFDITPALNAGLDARIDFFYDDSELGGQDAATLQMWKSTDVGSTWNIVASSANPGLHRVRAVGVGSFSRFSVSDAAHPLGAGGHLYSYQDKWNMVSLPLAVADARVSVLFPSAISKAYAYEAVYKIKDTLVPGVGYWLKFNGAQSSGMTGVAIQNDTAVISVGWNMIGSVTDSAIVGTAQVQEIPPGIVTSHYFGYSGMYLSASAIREGRAYWVKANAPGKIVLNSSLQAGIPQARFSDPLSEFSRLTITDGAGNSQTLYLGSSRARVAPSEYELPPVPPSPLFDARFGSQRYVEVYEAKSQKAERFALSLQSAVLPLTVKWEMRDITKIFSVLDEKSGKRIVLQGTGSAEFGTSSNSLVLIVDDWREIPVEFSLGPNYPNPFNPTTSFVVGLPHDAAVSIGVYNMVGQKVRTLVDEVRPGGYHTIQWDGMTDDRQAAGSGVYFVRVASQSFNAVRKIVMVR